MSSIPQIHFTTDNGTKFFARPIRPEDKELIKQGFSELSERSKYLRFFAVRSKLTLSQLVFFTEVDGKDHVAWGIVNESGPTHKPVGIGRLVRVKNEPDTAEIAIAIVDAYQKMGMGRVLFAILNIVADDMRIKKLRYHILEDNLFILNSLERFGNISSERNKEIIVAETMVLGKGKIISEYPELEEILNSLE